jgi:hypothetical protein
MVVGSAGASRGLSDGRSDSPLDSAAVSRRPLVRIGRAARRMTFLLRRRMRSDAVPRREPCGALEVGEFSDTRLSSGEDAPTTLEERAR